MEPENWIALGVFTLGIITLVLKVSLNMTKIRKDIIEKEVNTANKINNNYLKITLFEKEIIDMKKKHDVDIRDLRSDFSSAIGEFIKQNREDHQVLFNKIDIATKELTESATLIKSHLKEDKK